MDVDRKEMELPSIRTGSQESEEERGCIYKNHNELRGNKTCMLKSRDCKLGI
jgi:hypothetical protein